MGAYEGPTNFLNVGASPSLMLNFAREKSLTDQISGKDLVTFTRSSTGTYVGADGLIKTASADEARFDHDSSTGESLGLLIEESRTNLFTNSGNLTNPDGGYSWSFENTYSAPDGGNTASKVTQLNTNASVLTKSFVFTGTVLTYTIFTKAGSGFTTRPFGVYNITQSKDLYYVTFNYNTNTISGSSTFNGTTGYHSVTPYPNGWYRISITITNNITSGNSLQVYLGDTGGPKTSTSPGSYFYIWGGQVEAGSFPTSYIPTSGSTVTRSADNAQITGTNFSSWYNQSASTFYLESTLSPAIAAKKYFTLYDTNTASEIIEIATQEVGKVNVFTYDSSTTQSDVRVTSSTNAFKSVAGIVANNVNISVNGTLGTADTSATQPSGINRLYLGTYVNGSNVCNCPIKQLIYYPARISDIKLQQMTKVF